MAEPIYTSLCTHQIRESDTFCQRCRIFLGYSRVAEVRDNADSARGTSQNPVSEQQTEPEHHNKEKKADNGLGNAFSNLTLERRDNPDMAERTPKRKSSRANTEEKRSHPLERIRPADAPVSEERRSVEEFARRYRSVTDVCPFPMRGEKECRKSW